MKKIFKRIIIGIFCIVSLFCLTSCSFFDDTPTLSFKVLPKEVYVQNYSETEAGREISLYLGTRVYTLNDLITKGATVKGLDFSTPGNKVLVIIFDGNIVTFDYEVKESLNLSETLSIGDGEELVLTSITGVIWKSSDEEVAVVENGVLKAKSVGTTTITANGLESCEVTVTYFHNGNWDWSYCEEENPSEIANLKQWFNMYDMMSIIKGSDSYYGKLYGTYKLVNDIDFEGVDLPTYCNLYTYGDFYLDGNGHKIMNIDSTYSIFATGNDAYKYIWNLNIKNLTLENCSYLYGFGHYIYGTTSSITNVTFNKCKFNFGVCDYVYNGSLNMSDSSFIECNGVTSISYGTYGNSNPTINLNNVDTKDCKFQGGSYLFYCSSGNITMTNCDSINAVVNGISTMACGGFIGNATGAKVALDTCTISGSIITPSQTVAGFIGQANGNNGPEIKNCSVLKNTYLRSLGSGGVIAFASYLTNTSLNNTFEGYACSANIQSCSGYTFEKGVNWLKFTPLSSSDFEFSTEGVVSYKGDGEFEKMSIEQTITISRYDANALEWRGGYSRLVGDMIVLEDIHGETVLGSLPYITNYVHLVDNEVPVELQFSTSEVSIIENSDWCNERNRVYVKDGLLIMDSRLFATGSYDCFTAANEATPITSATMKISIIVYDGNNVIINSVDLYYSFTPESIE